MKKVLVFLSSVLFVALMAIACNEAPKETNAEAPVEETANPVEVTAEIEEEAIPVEVEESETVENAEVTEEVAE